MPNKDNKNKRELLNAEFEENFGVRAEETEEESHDSNAVKRRLLNLPQQSSPPSPKKSNDSNNNETKKKNESDDKKKKDDDNKEQDDDNKEQDDEKKRDDSTDRRKKRDDDHKNRSNDSSNKTDGRDSGSKTGEQLKNNIKDKSKDKMKDVASKGLKKGAKNGAKQGTKQAVKQGGKKVAAKAGKAAAAAAKKLVVKGLALAGKALLALVGYVGLPAILIGLAIIILIIILMVLSTTIFGTGQGIDELDEEAKEIRTYIVELSENSIDSSKPEQMQFRVPEELLAAIIQLESMLSEDGNTGSTEDIKDLLSEVAEQLKPDFTYESFTEWTETSTKVCANEKTVTSADGKTTTTECTGYEWSSPSRSSTTVDKITAVTAWNGSGTYEYEAEETGWETNGDTRTRSKSYVMKEQKFEYDFSKLDAILNERGYELEDKRWFEYFYEMATNQQMYYLTWLETGSVPEGAFIGGGGYGFDGEIIPGNGVPSQYMPIYLAAEAKYGIPWHLLASIHFTETTFSTHPSMNSHVGAIGHMQFMPRTWIGWSYKGGSQTGLGNISGIPQSVLTDPNMIRKHGGYGRDGNGDGKADPWTLEDAVHTAAYYLQKNGYATSPRNAVWHYNHDQNYVNKVLALSEKYKNAATYKPTGGGGVKFDDGNFNGPAAVKTAINEAYKYLGTPYQWGGFTPSTNFDCSGLTQWSFKKAGISIPRVSRDQYKATKKISSSEAKAGDLVFFVGTPGSNYITHVGLYLGGGMMINSQNRGVIVQPVSDWGNQFYAYTRIPGVNQ